ncbi:hypothetical protein [uncultured Bacteroides sp.]|nr:hypothetical protein [uncultured Bacteroides sp.]
MNQGVIKLGMMSGLVCEILGEWLDFPRGYNQDGTLIEEQRE